MNIITMLPLLLIFVYYYSVLPLSLTPLQVPYTKKDYKNKYLK